MLNITHLKWLLGALTWLKPFIFLMFVLEKNLVKCKYYYIKIMLEYSMFFAKIELTSTELGMKPLGSVSSHFITKKKFKMLSYSVKNDKSQQTLCNSTPALCDFFMWFF